MVSAVVMAGYSQKEIEDYQRQLKQGYNEEFIKCYKPVAQIGGKPIILFTLDKLAISDYIDDVVIVGEKHLLEEHIGSWVSAQKKEFKIVDQEDELGDKLIGEFCLNPSLVPHDSLCGNAVKAYAQTKAYQKRGYALFIASDSPLTSKEVIEFVLDESKKHTPESSIIYPFTSMEEKPLWRKAFHRKYAFLINDTDYKYKDRFRTLVSNREGFRASSFMFADPSRIDLNVINMMYSMRKVLSCEVRERIKHFLELYNLDHLIRRYFRGHLKISDCEKAMSKMLCKDGSRFTMMPIPDVGSTYDFDGTAGDIDSLKMIMETKDGK